MRQSSPVLPGLKPPRKIPPGKQAPERKDRQRRLRPVRKQIVPILDSSFLIAFPNKNDIHQAAAAKVREGFLRGEYGRALLWEYVFLEIVTVLLARRGLAVATAVARILLEAREVQFVPCSELFQETVETFRPQKGTTLSFTDAALVTIARRQRRGQGGGRRPSASLCGNPLVSPLKAKIPAGAFATRAAIPMPSPGFPLKGKYQK